MIKFILAFFFIVGLFALTGYLNIEYSNKNYYVIPLVFGLILTVIFILTGTWTYLSYKKDIRTTPAPRHY